MKKKEATENHKKEASDGKNRRLEQSQVAHKGCRNIFQAWGKEKPKENVDPLLDAGLEEKENGKCQTTLCLFLLSFYWLDY